MYKTYYIYFLSSSNNNTLYIGVTNNLERRIEEHRSGLIPGFTQKYNCHKLVYYEEYSDVNEAIAREKQLKKWSRSKKNELVDIANPEWKDLYPEKD
ncbi:MAG: GIY-YIG nuclease family protein [Candidatus Cryptobacteroides sp.]